MAGDAVFVWDDGYLRYDFGPAHPMRMLRAGLARDLAAALGVLDRLDAARPAPADDDTLALVHDPRYVASIRADPVFAAGVGGPDNPPFPGMHDAAALIAGGSVAAARAVWDGPASHAVNLAGGLHHAMRDRASGFCIYNDAALAIRALLAAGAERVAYVDTDAHHGDGVQAAFYDDPRVLTVSLHESGDALFPGTGWPGETGSGPGEGYAVNVALPPGTGDAGWLRALHAVVPSLLREFRPQVLVTQCGTDAHHRDPLTDLAVSVDGFAAAYAALHGWAHEHAGGRWVALGGGGYAYGQAVAPAWTRLLAELAHVELDPATPTPAAWRVALAAAVPGEPVPVSLTERAAATFTPWPGGVGAADDPVDRAVAATRAAVWPLHGLDPLDHRD